MQQKVLLHRQIFSVQRIAALKIPGARLKLETNLTTCLGEETTAGPCRNYLATTFFFVPSVFHYGSNTVFETIICYPMVQVNNVVSRFFE